MEICSINARTRGFVSRTIVWGLLGSGALYCDWPSWLGPNYNHTIEYDLPLVDNPGEIELLWQSDFNTANAACHGGEHRGCASPVLSNGFLYHYYFRGSDDGIICIDTKDGSTKWNRVFAGKGKTWTGHKNNLNNHSPVISNGRVFALGSKFRLYSVNASDGSVQWESTEHPHYGTTSGKSRQFNGALIAVGGVLIVPENAPNGVGYDYAMDIYGFSMEDGRKLWQADNVLGELATPTVVVLNAKAYVLTANGLGEMTLIDPVNGTVRWRKTGLGENDYTIVTSGAYTFCNTGTDNGRLGCFELTENGAILKWQLPASYGFPPNKQGVLPHGEHVFIRLNSRWVVARISDGAILGEFPYAVGNDDEAYMLRVGNRILNEFDSQHCAQQIGILNTNPADFKPLNEWEPPHSPTTSYSVPIVHPFDDGKMFIRGIDGIYCYDLRKYPDGRPRAAFTVDTSRGGIPFTVSFDAGSASDDVGIASYQWDFGDGKTGSGETVSHTYTGAGSFTATLSVTDGDNRSHAISATIHTVAQAPQAPTGVTAEAAASTEILVTWNDASSDEVQFRIERKDGSGSWSQIVRTDANTQSYMDKGLKAGVAYTYRIRSWNGIYSAYSFEASATTYAQDFHVWYEPECADYNGSVYQVHDDQNAAHGKYIVATVSGDRPPPSSDIISFAFDAPFSGSYKVWARGCSPNGGGADSWWQRVNDEGWDRLDINFYSTEYRWRQIREVPLETGSHRFQVAPRDKNCRLDKIFITSSSLVPEGDGEPDYTCEGVSVRTAVTRLAAAAVATLVQAPGGLRVNYRLLQPQQVRIDVLDLQGKRVRNLVDKVLNIGEHSILWNYRTDNGHFAAPGAFCFRVQTGNRVEYLLGVATFRGR